VVALPKQASAQVVLEGSVHPTFSALALSRKTCLVDSDICLDRQYLRWSLSKIRMKIKEKQKDERSHITYCPLPKYQEYRTAPSSDDIVVHFIELSSKS
jgi:hypothetical protein